MLTISVAFVSIVIIGVLLYAFLLEVTNGKPFDNLFIFIISLLKFGRD
jgi:hypothetical protein